MKFRSMTAVFLGVILIGALAGCGGGGGGMSSSSGTGRVTTYVADSPLNQYSSVLVTLYNVELGSQGTYTQTFSSSTGEQVNLAALSGVAQFLNSYGGIPAGTYNSVRVTIGNTMSLTPVNSTSSITATINPAVGTAVGSNELQIIFSLPTPMQISNGTNANLAVDFNLPGFVINGNNVDQMPIQEQSESEFQSEAKNCRIYGQVSNYTPATSTTAASFTLTSPRGTFSVTGSSGMQIIDQTNGSFGTSATLQNGDNVLVKGTIDPTTMTITATSVFILPPQATNGSAVAALEGTVQSVDTSANSFTVLADDMENMNAQSGVVTVQTGSQTKFIQVGLGEGLGLSQTTFSSLKTGEKVDILGTYSGSILDAAMVRIKNEGPTVVN